MPLYAVCSMPDEADARHGAYDFYAEQLEAPDDLKQLTDQYESMAFRRRGEPAATPRSPSRAASPSMAAWRRSGSTAQWAWSCGW